jgi:hypothetical protein
MNHRLDMLMGSFATALGSQTAFHCRQDDQGELAVISSAGLIPLAQINHLPTPGFVDRAMRAGHPTLELLDPERDASLIASAGATPLTHAASAPVRPTHPEALIAAFAGPQPDPTKALRIVESCAAMLAMCLEQANGFEMLIRAACSEQSLNGGQRHRTCGRW